MKFLLEELLNALKSNPKTITQVEFEVERIIKEESIEYVQQMIQVEDINLRFYALLILDKKMFIYKENNLPLQEIIDLSEFVLFNVKLEPLNQKKLARIISKLGVLAWPNFYPTFFRNIGQLTNKNQLIGFTILENFLYCMHNSLDIDESRRNELKRAVVFIQKEILDLLNQAHLTEEIILIFTHIVSIFPKGIDFSVIFEKGELFLEKTLDFFLEAIISKSYDEIFFDSLVNFSEKVEVEPKLLECFIAMKEFLLKKNLKLYTYAFKGLSKSIFTLSLSLQFWTLVFKKQLYDEFFSNLAAEVLQEVIRVSLLDYEDDLYALRIDDLESDIMLLISSISNNFPHANHSLLSKFGDSMPIKYAIILLKANKRRSSLNFQSNFLRCYSLYLDGQPEALNYLDLLDYTDKESLKLISSIIRTFPIDNQVAINLLNKLKDSNYAEEALVNLLIKINSPEMYYSILSGDMNLRKAIIFYYFLKNKPAVVSNQLNSFYSYFLTNLPFDRCFAICGLIYRNFELPKEILENIYISIDNYTLKDISYFCTDMLFFLKEDLQIQYLEKLFYRLKMEWEVSCDQKEISLTTKSFLSILESLIVRNKNTSKEVQYTTLLIEFLKTDLINFMKIYKFYQKSKFQFVLDKFVYHLLLCYNSYEFVDCQNEIIILLFDCLLKPDSTDVFKRFNIQGIANVVQWVNPSNNKRARIAMRHALEDIKGKPLSNMYEVDIKIQAQNIFGKKKNENQGDFEYCEM